MNDFDKEGFFKVLYICIISFFGATAKQINTDINDVATKNVTNLFKRVFFHGFSGWLFGLAAVKYLNINDLTSITVCAGIGGLFGYDAILFLSDVAINTLIYTGKIKTSNKNKK